MTNLLNSIPENLAEEFFEQLLQSSTMRIERIVSRGHVSPASGWYDQAEEEWVLVLRGSGKILFEDGAEHLLCAGDHMHIAARQKHRVSWTDPSEPTVWLAVFYSP